MTQETLKFGDLVRFKNWITPKMPVGVVIMKIVGDSYIAWSNGHTTYLDPDVRWEQLETITEEQGCKQLGLKTPHLVQFAEAA